MVLYIKIKALVAVRSGSLRVKNKNTRPFANSNLLQIKLEQLLRIPILDGIILNTSDEDMLSLGKKLGIECVKRDPYYSSNEVIMSDVFVNMAQHCETDVIVYTNVTNPLLKDNTLIDAINFFKENYKKFDSINSADILKKFMFINGKPINYDPKRQPRTQDLEPIYIPNAAFSILTKDTMISSRNIIGENPFMFEISEHEGVDIDNINDFEYAEYLYLKRTK